MPKLSNFVFISAVVSQEVSKLKLQHFNHEWKIYSWGKVGQNFWSFVGCTGKSIDFSYEKLVAIDVSDFINVIFSDKKLF